MKQDITEKLVIFYRNNVPGYIRNAGRTFLKIHAGADFTNYQDIKITIGDVARYYAHEACKITSGCRTIGDLTGATGARSFRLQKNALNQGVKSSVDLPV